MSATDSFTMAHSATMVAPAATQSAAPFPVMLGMIAGIGLLATLCEILAGIDLSAALALMQ